MICCGICLLLKGVVVAFPMGEPWAVQKIVEIHLNDSETKELAKHIIDAMPAEHKGAVN